MFTGTGDEEIAVEGMKHGLMDYVVKSPSHFVRLAASVQKALSGLEDRRQMQALMKETEERYRLLFENSVDAILLTIPNDRVLDANPAACRTFGRIREDLIGCVGEDILNIEDPRFKSAVSERAAAGRFRGELEMMRSNGGRFPAEVTSGLFLDRSGQPRAYMIIRDVSEDKKARQKINEGAVEVGDNQRGGPRFHCRFQC